MGFVKNQQIKMAARLLAWQYTKEGSRRPDDTRMEQQARQLVDDAHRIARQRGGNVLSILKEVVKEALRR